MNTNAPALPDISMDKKHMLPVKDKFQYILVILCEAPEICNALIDSFIEYLSLALPLEYFVIRTKLLCPNLLNVFLHCYGIYVIKASPTYHQYLMTEHGIKSLAKTNETSARLQ